MFLDIGTRPDGFTERTLSLRVQRCHILYLWPLINTLKYSKLEIAPACSWASNKRIGLTDWCQSCADPVQGALLRTFFDTVVASAIFSGVVCWSSSISTADRKRLDKLIRKASSALGCPFDSVQVVRERRMITKLSSMKERHRRSFLPAAVRLLNNKSK